MSDRRTVLIVDDNPDLAGVTASAIKKMIFPSSDGTEATVDVKPITAIAVDKQRLNTDRLANEVFRENPAAVVLDVRLRGDEPDDLSGIDLAYKVKSLLPDCGVILITSYGVPSETRDLAQNMAVFHSMIDRCSELPVWTGDLFTALKATLATHECTLSYRRKRFVQTVNGGRSDMWGLVLRPRDKCLVYERQAPLPNLKSNSVVVKLLEIGVCGTNHASLGSGDLPKFDLVDFHEAFGKVVWTGEDVRDVQVGDYVVPMVRRCDTWDRPLLDGAPITAGSFDFRSCEWQTKECYRHPDECPAKEYTEPGGDGTRIGYKSRGTGKCHGFGSEYWVDTEDWLVRFEPPPETESCFRERMMKRYVLTEPMSVVWKARREILKHYTIRECGDNVLVVGIGPIGLLASLVMRTLHPGLGCTAVDVVDVGSTRAAHVLRLGMKYAQAPTEGSIPESLKGKKFEIIVEATDQPHIVFKNYSPLLAAGGIFTMIGLPDKSNATDFDPKSFEALVKNRNILIGSINSARSDFEESIAFMQRVVGDRDFVLDTMVKRLPIKEGCGEELIRLGKQDRRKRDYLKPVLSTFVNESESAATSG